MSCHIYHTLTQTAQNQIEALHAVCQSCFPGPALLGLVLPESESPEGDTFYALYYMEETLVSFLSCFCPDGENCELSGFTAPSFRNRGFFSCLLKEATKEARRLFGDVAFYFQCLTSDPDAVSYCKARSLVFSHSECIMEKARPSAQLPATAVPGTAPAVAAGISLRPSTGRALLAGLHEKAFGCPAEFSIDYVNTILTDPDTSSYLILKKEKPVGLLHLTFPDIPAVPPADRGELTVYLMGLGVLPDYRRRGFAKAALLAVFALLPEASRLTLQVSTLNTAAFRLYEKLGFEFSSRLDYYTCSAPADV
ncbi:MAG: GNAT family N-acetyltransferase [Lachnospiraceae bacterium]|jgi:ribosomal protein S18 acetylase RimI-like enzyme|nr:GNAT family N-acetyltransferase [Lachnospiraceae bacterium]